MNSNNSSGEEKKTLSGKQGFQIVAGGNGVLSVTRRKHFRDHTWEDEVYWQWEAFLRLGRT